MPNQNIKKISENATHKHKDNEMKVLLTYVFSHSGECFGARRTIGAGNGIRFARA